MKNWNSLQCKRYQRNHQLNSSTLPVLFCSVGSVSIFSNRYSLRHIDQIASHNIEKRRDLKNKEKRIKRTRKRKKKKGKRKEKEKEYTKRKEIENRKERKKKKKRKKKEKREKNEKGGKIKNKKKN